MDFDISNIAESDGSLKEGFQEHLPEDVRAEIGDSKYFENIKTVPDLFKSAAGLSKLKGKKVIPSDDATDEEWNEFMVQLGVPEKAEDYGLKLEGVDEEKAKVLGEQKVLERLQNRYKAAGVPKRMATKLASLAVKEALMNADKATGDRQTKLAEAESVLKEEWKGDYERNNLLSMNAMTAFDPEAQAFLKEIGIADHPAVKRHFYKIATKMIPGDVVPGGGPSASGGSKSLAKTLGIV